MPKLTPDDLLAAAPDALRGDQTNARTLLQDVQQRAQERAREVRTRLGPSERTPLTLRKPSAPQPVPPVAPNWPVEIRLQKGRKVRATLVPGVAAAGLSVLDTLEVTWMVDTQEPSTSASTT